jgi:hypothetical protein
MVGKTTKQSCLAWKAAMMNPIGALHYEWRRCTTNDGIAIERDFNS